MSVAAVILALVIGCAIGWGWARNTVAKECERLGSFYVGHKTYHCSRVEEMESRSGYPGAPPYRNPGPGQ